MQWDLPGVSPPGSVRPGCQWGGWEGTCGPCVLLGHPGGCAGLPSQWKIPPFKMQHHSLRMSWVLWLVPGGVALFFSLFGI